MGMTKNVLAYGLVVGFFIVGCGQNQESPKYVGEDDLEIEKESKMMQQAEADARAEARARAEAELEARVKAEIEAESRAEAEAEVEVEARAEARVEAEARARAEARSRAEVGTGAEGRSLNQSRNHEDKAAFINKILIDNAYKLLDQGKYAEAISAAQNVLDNYDSDSEEAKSIIAKAKEKL